MIKRLLLFLVAEALLLAVAFNTDQWYKGTALLQQYAVEISTYLSDEEASAIAWANSHKAELESMAAGNPPVASQAWIEALQNQATANHTLLLMRGDKLLFASNNQIMPPNGGVLPPPNTRNLLKLPTGRYAANSLPYRDSTHIAILIPIQFALTTGPENHVPRFPANKRIPENVTVSPTDQAGMPIVYGGQPLGYLLADGPVESPLAQAVKFLFVGLAFLLFLVFLQRVANYFSDRYSGWAGALFLLGSSVGLMVLNQFTQFTDGQFGSLPLFSTRFENGGILGADNLGDWLLHLLLLLWTVMFFHQNLKPLSLRQAPQPLRFALAAVYYSAVMAGIWYSVDLLGGLVWRSGVTFDFENLFNLKLNGLMTLTGIIVWIAILFLFTHRLLVTIKGFELTQAQRVTAMLPAAVLLYVVSVAFPVWQVNALYLLAFGLMYLVVFDYFTDWDEPGFGWVACWLLLFSFFTALLLFRFNSDKDRNTRFTLAIELADERDTLAVEPALRALADELKNDTSLAMLLKPWPFRPEAQPLEAHINRQVYAEKMLFQHFRLRLYALDKDGQSLIIGQNRGSEYLITQNWEQARALNGTSAVRYRTSEEGKLRYIMRLPVDRMLDPSHRADVFCFFDREYPSTTRVYSELFYNLPYEGLEALRRYDFSVWKDGKRIVEKGPGSTAALNMALNAGEIRELRTADRVEAVYCSADEQTRSAVGRAAGGKFKQVYLVAILFTLSSLLLFLLALLNSVFHFLPKNFRFYLSTKGSLAKRIQYWNIMLIGAAFIVIGFFTYQHFTKAATEKERGNLEYRAEAVLNHLRGQVGDLPAGSDSLLRELPRTLAPLSNSLSMDVNLYTPSGDLLYTTQPALQQVGVLPSRMPAYVEGTMRQQRQSEATVTESVAGYTYSSRYFALRNNQNDIMGYIGVPYLTAERKIGPEVSDFIGILASLYMFLLLIAYTVTYLLARSIIKPINLISERIQELRFEDQNQPLEYAGDTEDELSELINEYNAMVDKLEDSKTKLIRLEREGAWREMARQIAHDIKNPLTTMKLSMQQLERLSGNPEQAAAYLKKAITRLIEQIDSLAQIASEFSMFANLDIQQKSDMIINDVVESVYDLFSEQKNVKLSLNIPDERFNIKADKNHLIRVFNNLIINAIQAIPSDREGHIKVGLYQDGDTAVVKISDNGGGIPPEIRERVFEPNFTTKTSGSGLGLAICKKIIEALDGTIRFETRDNEGTDFFVEMPIRARNERQVFS
ncbi:MAG: HAMP domain-containing histidine kinase [Saprospiraceae bacterium]|nr:HAMP domain-containing histidine kinase [Saprospiraceae bacterium]